MGTKQTQPGARFDTLWLLALRLRSQKLNAGDVLSRLRQENEKFAQPISDLVVLQIRDTIMRDHVGPARPVNEWCPGARLSDSNFTGCGCDCPACEASAKAMVEISQLCCSQNFSGTEQGVRANPIKITEIIEDWRKTR